MYNDNAYIFYKSIELKRYHYIIYIYYLNRTFSRARTDDISSHGLVQV